MRPLLIDTDLSTDCDDAAAIAIAHVLERRGEARLLGVVHNAALAAGVGGISSINHYFGRDDVPIGAYTTGGVGFNDYGPKPYVDELVRDFPGLVANASQAPSAVDVYRRVLAAADDASVTIASIGFATNLHALLTSEGGSALVAKKVKHLVVMGGRYPSSKLSPPAEWNFGACGPTNRCPWGAEPASRHYDALGALSSAVYDDLWPPRVPISFLGGEVGEVVLTGGALTDGAPKTSPVRAAYVTYNGPHGNRQSWDPMTVLYAVRGNEAGWYAEHAAGRNRVAPSGANAWEEDGRAHNQTYLVLHADQRAEAAAAIDALLLAGTPPPASGGLDGGIVSMYVVALVAAKKILASLFA